MKHLCISKKNNQILHQFVEKNTLKMKNLRLEFLFLQKLK